MDCVSCVLANYDSIAVSNGELVRITSSNRCVRAQANSKANLRGLAGASMSGVVGVFGILNVACTGGVRVRLESGLIPAAGETLYVSAAIAGRATNVAPPISVAIGTIKDTSNYAVDGRVLAVLSIGPVSVATPNANLANWTGIRYFACDLINGDDNNAGFSDVSQAAAGSSAVKTLDALMRIIPKYGMGRNARAAIRAGNYASDVILDLSGYVGYRRLTITGTADVPTAGAVAFAGDSKDLVSAGMQIADGTSAGGYNVISYSVDASGTATATLQLNGGGAPGFGALPAKPYGCRVRFDAATPTAALSNACSGVIFVSGGDTIELSLQFPAAPTLGDILYFEQAGVSGPATTIISHFGGDGSGNPSTQLVGLQLGTIQANHSRFRASGCEAINIVATECSLFVDEKAIDPTIPAFSSVGMGLRYGAINARGGAWNILSCMALNTGASVFFQPGSFVWERSSAGAQLILYGGSHADGNIIVETIGTHGSTVHGATCRIWGTAVPPQGTQRCGLWLGGGYRTSRIKFSNMGANPCVRQNGTGAASSLSNLLGDASDGNLDVGLDLSPNGRVGDTIGAMGCVIAMESQPVVTGSNGDVRLPDGTIMTWAAVMAGFTDSKGNRFIA